MVSGEISFSGLQAATFWLCPLTAFYQCDTSSGSSSSSSEDTSQPRFNVFIQQIWRLLGTDLAGVVPLIKQGKCVPCPLGVYILGFWVCLSEPGASLSISVWPPAGRDEGCSDCPSSSLTNTTVFSSVFFLVCFSCLCCAERASSSEPSDELDEGSQPRSPSPRALWWRHPHPVRPEGGGSGIRGPLG